MKRKFAVTGFPFLFGLLAFSVSWGKYNIPLILAGLALALTGILFLAKHRVYILVFVLMFMLGISYASIYTAAVYNKLIAYDNKTVTINGYVKDYKHIGNDLEVLTVKGKVNGGTTAVIPFIVENGDYDYFDNVQITGTVSLMQDNIDFQKEQYYRPKGVYLEGGKAVAVEKTGSNKYPLLRSIKHYRDYMFELIMTKVGGDEGGFLGAMLCGDKSELSFATKQKLYRTGIGHIFSVSGTHMVIISTFFGAILGIFPLNRKLRFLLMQIVIWSFAVFAGMSPSVTRAAIMLTLILCSDLFKRKGDCLNTLGFCCIVLTVGNPYTVRDPSFLLSLSGAFAMGVAAPYFTSFIQHTGLIGDLLKSIATMFTLMFTVMPVTLLFFDEVSLAAPISNLILVPICTVALSLAFVAALTCWASFIAVPILRISGYIIKLVLYISDKIGSLRYSYITVGTTTEKIIFVCIAVLAISVLFLSRSHMQRGICIAMFYTLFIVIFNVSSFLKKDIVHIIMIPHSNSCQVVLYQNHSGVMLDNNALQKQDNAIERLCEKRGIEDIDTVTIKDSYYFNNVQIQTNKSSYDIDISDLHIRIYGNVIYIDGKDMSNDKHIRELIYSNNKYELKELDYGFGEQ